MTPPQRTDTAAGAAPAADPAGTDPGAAAQIVLGAAAIPEPDRQWLRAVEALPVASVWQGGHVLPPTGTGEVVTRLALLTAWTEHVRVGSATIVLPLYQPVVLAKQLLDLDVHSGGRLTVGVGVGGEFPAEFDAVGVPLAERGARTDEAIAVLRALWGGGPTSFAGRFHRLDQVTLRAVALAEDHGADPGPSGGRQERAGAGPAPAGGGGTRQGRPGGPPIVVSGRRPAAMRRAARLGDGWMPYLVSPGAYARSVQTIRTEAAAAGRTLEDFEWLVFLYTVVRRDGDRARDELAAFLGKAYGDKPAAMLEAIAPAGTPAEVAAAIQRYVDAGARHIVIAPAVRSGSAEVVRLAAEEVLPRLTVPAAAGAGHPAREPS